MSRKIEDLQSNVAELCTKFIETCKEQGVEVLITSTLRTKEEQDKLFAIGRTEKGSIVTHLKGGSSIHELGLAFDFVPMIDGKPEWNSQPLWDQCGQIAETLGLEWGGKIYKNFVDKPHCQLTGGLTYSQLKKGKPA